MSQQRELRTVKCTVESIAKARRLFEQHLPPCVLPPHYFESVIHNGAFKWAVLAGHGLYFVPFNCIDKSKVHRIELEQVRAMDQDDTSKVWFTDDDLSNRTTKTTLHYSEVLNQTDSSTAAPTLRGFIKSADFANAAIFSTVGKPKEEAFHTHEHDTKLFYYLRHMWIGLLSTQLHGWECRRNEWREARVRLLYEDLQHDIAAAKTLQERVDLVDEAAAVIHYNIHLKRCLLMQSAPLVKWLISEIRRFALPSWAAQPDMADLGRGEALLYLTALLELLHRALFQCWPLFATHHQGGEELARFIEPKGTLEQIVAAVMSPLVEAEELSTSKYSSSALEVIHLVAAIVNEARYIYLQARTQNVTTAGGVNALALLVCRVAKPGGGSSPEIQPIDYTRAPEANPHVAKWLALLSASFKHVLVEGSTSSESKQLADLYTYASLTVALTQLPSVRRVVKSHHIEEVLHFSNTGRGAGQGHPIHTLAHDELGRLAALLKSDRPVL